MLLSQLPSSDSEPRQRATFSKSDSRDPVFESLSPRPSSVDRSPMTVIKSSRSIKASRRNLVIGLDTNIDTSSNNNDHHDILKGIIANNPNHDLRATSSPPFSALSPKLRRRKNLSIGKSSNSTPTSVKPIAISLTFATPQIPSPKVSISALRDHETPAEPDLEPNDTFDAPSFPNLVQIPTQLHLSHDRRASASPPSTPSSASASFRPSSPTNVRLGHPSRPYYSAIRKQGISPTSSRRSSIKAAATSPTRPKSYSPPSPLPAYKSTLRPPAQRHLSLSAVPPISAFSLDDDSDDDADQEQLPVIPLTPVSGRMSFGTSLASVAKSLARKRSKSGPSAFTFKHSQSASMSSPPLAFPLSVPRTSIPALEQGNVNGKGFKMSATTAASGSPGIGFSVSGETELKMALAFSEAQATKKPDSKDVESASTPAIQEAENVSARPSLLPSASTATSPTSHPSSLYLPNSSNSIANRIKKLRQGLKDMLLTTTQGHTGTSTNLTTTTTTTTTTSIHDQL